MNTPTSQEMSALIAECFADLFAQSLAPGAPANPASAAFAALVQQKLSSADAAQGSITLDAALIKFWGERSKQWSAATHHDAKLVFRWMREHFGPGAQLASIKKANAAAFREGLLRLERRSKEASFQARQTEDAARRIVPRTAGKYLDFAQSFFNWAAGEAGLIEHSPFAKLTIKFSKKNSPAAAAATPEALEDILRSPLFQGHHPEKVHQKGPIVERGDFYWAFVLQFYFGARIGEIAQLRVADVRLKAAIPYIHFRKVDDHGHPINGNTLKTVNAERKIPVGDDLIVLGFLDFVSRKRGAKAFLFPSLAPSRNQKSSSKASKFGQRYLERIGQKSPRKATHWLRHALVNALRASHAPEYVISQVVGHAHTAMHAQYGTFEDLAAAKKALDNADWKFGPRAILMLSKDRWRR